MPGKFTVTPWEVTGDVDYGRIVKEFGIEPLTEELARRIEKQAGYRHLFLRRGLFFAHRDLDVLLRRFESGGRFALYTGRGPSGHTHLGHLIPWMFTKYLQDAFGASLYFQMTDDEKFLVKDSLTQEQTRAFAYDNALDLAALGFEPKQTRIFANTEYAGRLYGIAVKVAKHITYSTAKAVFGFTNDTNIGMTFFPAMQAAPCFLIQELEGAEVHCLIPCAVDQDPYFRVARDVAPKLAMPKPALVHSKFFPGLGSGGKMSASEPETSIFMTDDAETATRKIMRAFTGGRESAAEQRRLGGNPDACPVHQYFRYLFEEDDSALKRWFDECRSGKILCGDCKRELAKRVVAFLAQHQKKREAARKKVEKFFLRD
jgi:tryptophanyl-tRNA synthetase